MTGSRNTLERWWPWIGGAPVETAGLEFDTRTNPWSGEPVAEVAVARAEELEAAIAAAERGFAAMRALGRYRRRDILAAASQAIANARESLAHDIAVSAGKPITQALAEVDRAVLTFSLAADEARRYGGDVVPLDVDPRAEGMTGLMHRFPIGPISAITPFNFPLNLLAHKVAPAIAIGSAVVVKPPPQCPQVAFRLARLLHEAGLPEGGCNVLHLPVPLAERLATDPRFGLLSFTGSARVGWHLKSIAGRKRVLLELGGDAAAVIHDDAPGLDGVAARIALGAFAYAGQVCIRVQRIYAHERIYDRFMETLVASTRRLQAGDPLDPDTAVGPMIDAAAADRVEQWTEEAIAAGARPLLRGERRGTLLTPTILADVPSHTKVQREEIFGPVLVVNRYREWGEALDRVNESEYGLQAGVFTRDVHRIFEAFNRLEVGGVIANEFPTLRIDNYPYGGVKQSGLGREGVRYAIEEMSEMRMLVLNLAAQA